MRLELLKTPALALVCVSILVAGGLLVHSADNRKQEPASKGKEQIVRLFKLRVEASKLQVKMDTLKVNHTLEEFEALKSLHNVSAASKKDMRHAQFEYEYAAADLEISKNQLKVAEVQLELVEIGVRTGEVNLEDVQLPSDLLTR